MLANNVDNFLHNLNNCHPHRDVTNNNFFESTIFQSRSIHSIIGFLLLTQAVGVGCATLNLTEYYKNYCYFYLKIWFFAIVCIPMMAMQILYSYRVYYQLGHYARVLTYFRISHSQLNGGTRHPRYLFSDRNLEIRQKREHLKYLRVPPCVTLFCLGPYIAVFYLGT